MDSNLDNFKCARWVNAGKVYSGGDGVSDLVKRLRGKYSVGPNGVYEDRDFGSYTAPICKEAANRIEELEEKLGKAEKGLESVFNLINDSVGVAGLHLNGDVALWDSLLQGGQFEGWLIDFSEAMEGME